MVSKYTPHAAPYLLKLKSDLNNSKLESAENNLDEWISYFEEIKIWIQYKR